ncbi:hypothetical protein FMEXI_3723 [Fusarium mexicanum]|uniref:Uncharacterized protein n=1 Tax=Fusarium mexicanum TaxID=751941 RepID=A0A8H5N3F7_9HYPO|nr:hypothetical protein FMEXI_3723 [Fusarium mexicanum]
MIDYLLSCLGVTFDKFVQSPKATFQHLKVDEVARFVRLARDNALAASGTCSALPMNVSRLLIDAERGTYDFQMYDSGDHKICRCLKTFTIIDSSSEHHAIIKPPGEAWPYQKQISIWDSDGNGKKTNYVTVRGEKKTQDLDPK